MSHSESPHNATSSVVQRYVQLWPQLKIVDGVLCRCSNPKSMSDAITVSILPDSLHQQAMRQAHDAASAGHQQRLNSLDKLQQLAYWVGINKDVEVYCRECYRCQETKPPAPKKAPLISMPIGRQKQMVLVDILEVPILSRGN